MCSQVLPEAGAAQVCQSQTLPSLCVKEYLHQLQDTQNARGTGVDKGTGLRAPLELEEVDEVLGRHRGKAAVGVSRGAGVSRVLRRGRRGGSGHTATLLQKQHLHFKWIPIPFMPDR